MSDLMIFSVRKHRRKLSEKVTFF